MIRKHHIRKLFSWTGNQRLLVTVACLTFLVFAFPWASVWGTSATGTVFGIPTAFLLMFVVVPICLCLLSSYLLSIMEDNDRHDPELENE